MNRKITKRTVDEAKPSQKDQFIWDSELKGFGLKVTPKGRKVYIVQYRPPNGRTRRYTLGKHGSPWTPVNARTEATRLFGLIAAGEDPAEAKQTAREDVSVAELCDLYVQQGGRTKKVSTRNTERMLIARHIKPLVGKRFLLSLRRADIDKMMKDIADGKTASDQKTRLRGRSIVRGGKSAANRTLGLLSPMLEFAVEQGLRADNPARGVKKYKEGRPARFLSNEEIARLGDALRTKEAQGANPYAIAAIRLLLLTGCRKSEILFLKWAEVDFPNAMLRLPDSKTGAKVVHLGAPALSLLCGLPRQHGNPFVIVGERNGSHLVNLQKVWERIRIAADLDDVRIHDLRHSFASVAARSGESLLVIGKVLGHATTAATSRYAHLSDDPVRSVSSRTSNRITELLAAKESP